MADFPARDSFLSMLWHQTNEGREDRRLRNVDRQDRLYRAMQETPSHVWFYLSWTMLALEEVLEATATATGSPISGSTCGDGERRLEPSEVAAVSEELWRYFWGPDVVKHSVRTAVMLENLKTESLRNLLAASIIRRLDEHRAQEAKQRAQEAKQRGG